VELGLAAGQLPGVNQFSFLKAPGKTPAQGFPHRCKIIRARHSFNLKPPVLLGIQDYLITYQGALVRHAVTGETLFHRPVPLNLARELIELVKGYGYHMNIYVDDLLFVAERTPEGERYAAHSNVPLGVVGDLDRF